MSLRSLSTLTALTAALTTASVHAHHSVKAEFDTETTVSLEGQVTQIEWINPHTLLVLETADGTAWRVETTAPNAMLRAGIPRDFLSAGDRVGIEVWRALDGSPRAHLRAISYADGRRLELPEDRWMGAAEAAATDARR